MKGEERERERKRRKESGDIERHKEKMEKRDIKKKNGKEKDI